MTTALRDILDHESGDSWNGTHYRQILVSFNKAAQTVAVVSVDKTSPTCRLSEAFPLSDVKEQILAGDLKTARYFGNFAIVGIGVIPDLVVEGADPTGDLMQVGRVFFDGAVLQRDLPVKPLLRLRKKPSGF